MKMHEIPLKKYFKQEDVHSVLRLKLNCTVKISGRASLRNTTQRLCLLPSTVFYNRVRPNTGMRGIELLHDNAPAHRCNLAQEYLVDENTETLSHPPYSPDFAPCNFFLFPHLKKKKSCWAKIPLKIIPPFSSAIFQCLLHKPAIEFKRAISAASRKTSKVCYSRRRIH